MRSPQAVMTFGWEKSTRVITPEMIKEFKKMNHDKRFPSKI